MINSMITQKWGTINEEKTKNKICDNKSKNNVQYNICCVWNNQKSAINEKNIYSNYLYILKMIQESITLLNTKNAKQQLTFKWQYVHKLNCITKSVSKAPRWFHCF